MAIKSGVGASMVALVVFVLALKVAAFAGLVYVAVLVLRACGVL
jgi:hypothetical protein